MMLTWIRPLSGLVTVAGFALFVAPLTAQVVPGSGFKIENVGDDFEEENWGYTFNNPKASSNLDKRSRFPAGFSSNGRWFESAYRGHPDVLRIVDTPEGGLPGSTKALMMTSLKTGIPGTLTHEMQQDDFMLNVNRRIGRSIPVGHSPSGVVRVWLPPFEKWENRTGSHFGIRADVTGLVWDKPKRRGLFGRKKPVQKVDSYWPGFFIQFNSETDPRFKEDSAVILVRGDHNGHEIMGPAIKEPGWWTFGISLTGDGQVHFYAKPGVEDLTAGDRIASSFPYNAKAQYFHTIFFNIVNMDNGRSWATPFVIDDPAVYRLVR